MAPRRTGTAPCGRPANSGARRTTRPASPPWWPQACPARWSPPPGPAHRPSRGPGGQPRCPRCAGAGPVCGRGPPHAPAGTGHRGPAPERAAGAPAAGRGADPRGPGALPGSSPCLAGAGGPPAQGPRHGADGGMHPAPPRHACLLYQAVRCQHAQASRPGRLHAEAPRDPHRHPAPGVALVRAGCRLTRKTMALCVYPGAGDVGADASHGTISPLAARRRTR
jgi:hypothetical protein